MIRYVFEYEISGPLMVINSESLANTYLLGIGLTQ